MRRQESGFTLVEIAIVLVIIGLLLGGILKGQELINSARVRNLADTSSGIQAAYFGFIDRYRRVPGDWDQAGADAAIGGTAIAGGGNNNGRLDHTPTPYGEPNALWEHLSKAGFINGSYDGGGGTPDVDNNNAPFNPFNGAISMARTNEYEGAEAPKPVRLHLVIGRGIPVDILRELDTKLDDSTPDSGSVRATVNDTTGSVLVGPGGSGPWGAREDACTLGAVGAMIWNVDADSQDCNAVFMF